MRLSNHLRRFQGPIRCNTWRRPIGPNPTLVHARMPPELARDLERGDTGNLPPCPVVRRAMHRAVVRATQRDSEFVAGLAAERPRLDVAKMMRIRWLAAADEACLLSDVAQMLAVAVPTRRSDREDALVDAAGLITRGTGSWLLLRRYLWRCGTLACQSLAYDGR